MSEKVNISAETIVYNNLKNALYERRLAPGTALIERSISEKLGIGRTPVRAALRKLAIEGFVDIIPNRGAFVVSTTKEQFKMYYDARIELHMLAVRRGIDSFTDSDFTRMEELIEKEEVAVSNLKFKEYLDIVGEFYAIIMSKSGNWIFEEFYWEIYTKTHILLVLYDDFFMPSRSQIDSIQTHMKLIESLKKKDIGAVETSLRRHFAKVVNNLQFDKTATANLDFAL